MIAVWEKKVCSPLDIICNNSFSDNTHFTGNKEHNDCGCTREFPQCTEKHKGHNVTLLRRVQFMRGIEFGRTFAGENYPK